MIIHAGADPTVHSKPSDAGHRVGRVSAGDGRPDVPFSRIAVSNGWQRVVPAIMIAAHQVACSERYQRFGLHLCDLTLAGKTQPIDQLGALTCLQRLLRGLVLARRSRPRRGSARRGLHRLLSSLGKSLGYPSARLALGVAGLGVR